MWGAVVGISIALGPVVGGALVTSAGWRSIFWVNVPVGIVAVILALRYIPESKAPHPRRPDPVGQVLVIVVLACLTYGIIEGPGRGWGSPLILTVFALALVGLAGLLVYGPRRARAVGRCPLLSLGPVQRRHGDGGGGVRRPGRVPVREHPLPPGSPRPVGPSRRPGHSANGGGDDGDVAAVGPHRRYSRVPLAARCVGRGPRVQLRDPGPYRGDDTFHLALRCLHGLRAGLWPRQRAHHQRRRVGDAESSGRRGGGDRVHVPSGRPDPGGGRGRCSRYLADPRAGPFWPGDGQPPRLVGLVGCGGAVLVLGLVATSRWALETARRTAAALNPEVLGAGGGRAR